MAFFSSRLKRLATQFLKTGGEALPSEIVNLIEGAIVPALADATTKILFDNVNKENIGKNAMFNFGDNNHMFINDGYQAVTFFDGVDDELQLASDFNLEAFSSTLSFWVRFLPGVADPYIFGNSANTDYIRIIGDEIELQANSSTGTRRINVNIPTLQLNTWVHICIARDNEDVLCYINGEFKDRIVNWSVDDLLINRIGTWQTGISLFSGLMQDVLMYDRLLSPSEIKTIYNCGNVPVGPLHSYPLDEILYDGTISDQIGSNTITVVGCQPDAGRLAYINADTRVMGLSDGYVWTDWQKRSFTSRSYMTFPNLGTVLSLHNSTAITKSIWWMNDQLTSGTYAVWDVEKDGISDFGFGVDSGALMFYYNFGTLGSGSLQLTEGSFIMRYRKWNHLCATYDGTDLKLFVNGVIMKELNGLSSDTVQHSFITTINARVDTVDQSPQSAYHDARIYNTGLTDEQVLQLYNGEKDVAENDLVWHVPFDQTDYGSGIVDRISSNNGVVVGTSTTVHKMAPKFQNIFVNNGIHMNGATYLLSSLDSMFDSTFNELENVTMGFAMVSRNTRAFEGMISLSNNTNSDYFAVFGGTFYAAALIQFATYNYTRTQVGSVLPTVDPYEVDPLFFTYIINFKNREVDKVYIDGVDQTSTGYTYHYTPLQPLNSDIIAIGNEIRPFTPVGGRCFMGDYKYLFVTEKEFNDADALSAHNYLKAAQS